MPQLVRAACTAGLFALAACGRDTGACAGPCAAAVVVAGAEADILLPAVTTNNVGAAIGDQLFLRLADLGTRGNTVGDDGFVPKLARSWHVEDSLTWVFRLHPAARWHDGRPVTAADVAFTFAVYRDPRVPAISRPQLARIAAVEAPDDTTVVFRFTEPYLEQFFDATQHLRILPRHLLDSVPRDRLAHHPFGRAPVGNGPYRFIRWVSGERVELEADTTFFLGPPGIRRLIWRFTADAGAAVTQLLAGEADIIAHLSRPEDAARAAASPTLRLREYPGLSYYYLSFNLRDPANPRRPHPLFGDRALRRALGLGIDRDLLLDAVLDGRGVVPRGPITPAVWAWQDSLVQLPFAPDRARALLDSLGWHDRDGDGIRDRNGRPLAFELLVPTSSPPRARAAVILQDQFARLGVDVRVVGLEFLTWETRVRHGRFHAALGGRFVDPTPGGLTEFWTSGAPQNAEGYASAHFDSLARAAVAARDIHTARRLWHEAIAVLNADAPGIWLWSPLSVAAVHRRFRGVTLVPGHWATTLWTWQGTAAHPETPGS